jgi:hypothetical protein
MVTVNGVIVLFGGAGLGDLFDDTWTFDGTRWQPAGVTGPGRREQFGMATFKGVVLLFGGLVGFDAAPNLTVTNDMWTWDGLAWTEVTMTGAPPARYSAGMAMR